MTAPLVMKRCDNCQNIMTKPFALLHLDGLYGVCSKPCFDELPDKVAKGLQQEERFGEQ